jgi:hypothetical protein
LGIDENDNKKHGLRYTDILHSPSLWGKMDQILDYVGIATTGNVLDYIRDEVSPEVAKRWLDVGIANSREIRWAELVSPHLQGHPVGYVGAMAKVLSKSRSDSWRGPERDRLYEELSADDEALHEVIDDIVHNRETKVFTGVYKADWNPSVEWRHIPSLEVMSWAWADVKIEPEIVNESQQLDLLL